MTEKTGRARIRIDLTRRQKEQIRRVAGREVTSLELRLHSLPEPAELPARAEERADW